MTLWPTLLLTKKSKHRQQKKMSSCWKDLDHSLNNFEGLNLWSFVTIGPTLTCTTPNYNNLRIYLEANQCIDYDMCNNRNRQYRHGLPQACGRNKSVCPVWIGTTGNFQSHPKASFRINERWSNIYNTHNSTIKDKNLMKKLKVISYQAHQNSQKQYLMNK